MFESIYQDEANQNHEHSPLNYESDLTLSRFKQLDTITSIENGTLGRLCHLLSKSDFCRPFFQTFNFDAWQFLSQLS